MYVVKRAFRNYNQMMVPGSEIEPGTVKHLKSRLRDRVIIEVSEHDFDKWNKYFIEKYGTPITRIVREEVKAEEVKAEEVKAEEVKAEEVKAKPKAKAVKVTVK